MQLRYLQAPAQGLSCFEPRAAYFSSQLLTCPSPFLCLCAGSQAATTPKPHCPLALSYPKGSSWTKSCRSGAQHSFPLAGRAGLASAALLGSPESLCA